MSPKWERMIRISRWAGGVSSRIGRCRLHVLHRPGPAAIAEVEDDVVFRSVLALIERVLPRRWPTGEIGRARAGDLSLGLYEIIDPHPEMGETRLQKIFISAIRASSSVVLRPIRQPRPAYA